MDSGWLISAYAYLRTRHAHNVKFDSDRGTWMMVMTIIKKVERWYSWWLKNSVNCY